MGNSMNGFIAVREHEYTRKGALNKRTKKKRKACSVCEEKCHPLKICQNTNHPKKEQKNGQMPKLDKFCTSCIFRIYNRNIYNPVLQLYCSECVDTNQIEIISRREWEKYLVDSYCDSNGYFCLDKKQIELNSAKEDIQFFCVRNNLEYNPYFEGIEKDNKNLSDVEILTLNTVDAKGNSIKLEGRGAKDLIRKLQEIHKERERLKEEKRIDGLKKKEERKKKMLASLIKWEEENGKSVSAKGSKN